MKTLKTLIRKSIAQQFPFENIPENYSKIEEVNKKYFRPLNSMKGEKFLEIHPQFMNEEIRQKIEKSKK